MSRLSALKAAAVLLLAACAPGALAQVKKMENIPLPSAPKTTIEVNPWTTGQNYTAIEARCGDAIVFTWTPLETHGVFRPVARPTKAKNGTFTCACPPMPSDNNGTVGEGLLLAPLTKGGSYRYIVTNESKPYCLTSQGQGDCAKGMRQVVVPSCPAPPAGAAASSAMAVAMRGSVAAGVVGLAAAMMMMMA